VVSVSNLLAFALASLILIAIPGPSVLFVISRAVALGRRAALATVAGNCAGVYCQVILVALGVGVLVERSAVIYNTIKLAGAIYLVWLGVRTFQKRRSLGEALGEPRAPKSGRRILRDGFVVGLTNPKAAVFFAAILPQFVDTSRGHVPAQMLILGLVFVLIAMVVDSIWGLVAGTARERLVSSPRRLDAIGGASGVVLVGLGVGLAVTGRKP
jgi:threonine/homoserine/homoserine lactone efflux protein